MGYEKKETRGYEPFFPLWSKQMRIDGEKGGQQEINVMA
jgi:hypothetical protein